MNATEAIDQLHRDLAVSVRASRADAEAIVITQQQTAREVLTEVERLRELCNRPQQYAIIAPKLTAAQKKINPVPVVPFRLYGRSRIA